MRRLITRPQRLARRMPRVAWEAPSWPWTLSSTTLGWRVSRAPRPLPPWLLLLCRRWSAAIHAATAAAVSVAAAAAAAAAHSCPPPPSSPPRAGLPEKQRQKLRLLGAFVRVGDWAHASLLLDWLRSVGLEPASDELTSADLMAALTAELAPVTKVGDS